MANIEKFLQQRATRRTALKAAVLSGGGARLCRREAAGPSIGQGQGRPSAHQGGFGGMARHIECARLACEPLAGGMGRLRLDRRAEVHFRGRNSDGPRTPDHPIRIVHAGPGSHQIWH